MKKIILGGFIFVGGAVMFSVGTLGFADVNVQMEDDLGKTCLDNLELDMSGIKKLVLPKDARFLKLYGKIRPELRIDDSLCSGKLTLEISLKKALLKRYRFQKTGSQGFA